MSQTSDAGGAVEALESAHERLETLRDRIDLDREDLEAAADAYRSVTTVLDRWEERATDWDDFEGYVEFRNDLSDTLEAVPEDVPESDALVEADRHVKTGGVSGSLGTADFRAAREALEPLEEYAEREAALAEARETYESARRAARERRRELADRVDDLERLVRLGDADLDAPTEVLREPVERYDEAVEAAFERFRREAPAREVLSFVAEAAGYPLVDYEAPPEALIEYVTGRPAGEHTLGELLDYAGYSRSKLDHYVDDPDLLKRRVSTNRTYLEGLSADPLRIGWPPAPAGTLRRRAGELVSLVGRFADEETVAALREVRRLTRRSDYERLRTAAEATARLSDAERRRLADGSVRADLEAARERLAALDDALERLG